MSSSTGAWSTCAGTSYQSFEDLLHYCRCVAGSIGRLSLGIFGTRVDAEQAARLADSLGVALQLTNILRDVREDYASGRVYLPAEDLAKFSVCLGGDAASPGGRPPGIPRSWGRTFPPSPPRWGGQAPLAPSSPA